MAGSRRKEVGLVLTDESNIVDMRRIIPDLDNILQIAFLCLAVAIVLAQANPFYQFPNRDGGLFMYMGSQILDGKLLYVDIWDNKGPLIFYINALGLFLGRGLRWGVWGVEFVFVFLAAFLGFNLMKKFWGLVPAIFGTLLWLAAFNNVARGGNFTEGYALLFNFAALYIFWLDLQKGPKRVYLFLVGVLLVLSFLLRANNIGVEFSIILVIILSAFLDKDYRQSLKQLLWVGLGSLFVLVVVSLYFLSLGTLDEMIVAGYVYNFFYNGEAEGVGELSRSVLRGVNLLGYISVIPTLLGFLILLEKLPDAIRSRQNFPRNFYLLILIGLPIEILLSSLSGRNYPHYYICWLPYIAVLSGLLMNTLIPAINENLNKHSMATLLIVISLLVLSKPVVFRQYSNALGRLLFDRSAGVEIVHPAAKYVRENTDPADTVLVWGFQPYINLMARRDSPTGVLSYPLLVESPFSDELNARFLQDLIEKRPVLIVDMVNPDNDTIPFIDPAQREVQQERLKRFHPPSNLDLVFDFIYKNYHVETNIKDVVIYRLNTSTP